MMFSSHGTLSSTGYSLPLSQKRTYSIIVNAVQGLPTLCNVNSDRYLSLKWPDGTTFNYIKAKNIYKIIDSSDDIIQQLNQTWSISLDCSKWKKILDRLWKSPIAANIQCFKWLLMLNRLPIVNKFGKIDTCKFCNMRETSRHIFFDCRFARAVWASFGIYYPLCISIFDIVSGFIYGIKKDTNIFWFILSTLILRQIWKCRNEEKFADKGRSLTEFTIKLTHFFISSQVMVSMLLDRDKLKRLLWDSHYTMFMYELRNGFDWRCMDNEVNFNYAVSKLNEDYRRKGSQADKNMVYTLAQIQKNMSIVWMEGPLG